MRILIITPEYRGFGGGIMTFYRHLAPALTEAGHEVFVIEGSGFGIAGRSAAETPGGIHIRSLDTSLLSKWMQRFAHFTAAPTLRRLMASSWAAWDQARSLGRFDVVEVVEFGLLHAPHALRPLAPTVAQCHAGWGQMGLHESSCGQELDRATALAIESEALRHMSARHTYALANSRWWADQLHLPFSCIRPPWKPPSDSPPRQRSTEIDPVIRVFGRIQAWKGPRECCQALSLAPEIPSLEWYGRDVAVDSNGTSTNDLMRSEFPAVWGTRILTRNPVPPQEVSRLQATALLNLVPSTWDVFNFTAAEAMASARPVICSDGAGASELIEDGRTGFVYDGSSAAALADVMRRALSLGPAELARIGAAGREAALAALDPMRQAAAHATGYESAMRSPVMAEGGPPAWFKALAEPREPSERVGASHLDQHPLRGLASYVVKRGLRKAGLAS
ncbi:MAG: glycosyltransferase family 4 protein [Rubrivivax sp.]|nr:glycosyltransferase family 4 protein [Rubrivivax sp.]